jgi:hypothetical protein
MDSCPLDDGSGEVFLDKIYVICDVDGIGWQGIYEITRFENTGMDTEDMTAAATPPRPVAGNDSLIIAAKCPTIAIQNTFLTESEETPTPIKFILKGQTPDGNMVSIKPSVEIRIDFKWRLDYLRTIMSYITEHA